jgi:hypothetical protein
MLNAELNANEGCFGKIECKHGNAICNWPSRWASKPRSVMPRKPRDSRALRRYRARSERECKPGRQRARSGDQRRPHADYLGSLANEAFKHPGLRTPVFIRFLCAVLSIRLELNFVSTLCCRTSCACQWPSCVKPCFYGHIERI